MPVFTSEGLQQQVKAVGINIDLVPDRPNGNNSSYYNNPDLEATIARANSPLDENEQKTLYARAQKIVSDDASPTTG